jgi:hypothetical protein
VKHAETRFRLSAKRTSPFKSAGASVQSTTCSPGVRVSDSNAGYTMFRGSEKGIGYSLHSPVSTSLPLPCVTVCHPISTGLYDTSLQLHVLLFVSVYSDLKSWPSVKDITAAIQTLPRNVRNYSVLFVTCKSFPPLDAFQLLN